MKNIVLSAILLFMICGSSCDLKEQKRIDAAQVNQIEDSIAKIIPGVRSIHTIQKPDEFSKVMIIVGAPAFYSADDDKKQQAAINTGTMLMHVLGADNSITNGTLVFTRKDMDTSLNAPQDGISVDMKIDSLKKVIYPAK